MIRREPTLISKVIWAIYVLIFFGVFTAASVAVLAPMRFQGDDPEEVLACQRNLERLQNAVMLYAEVNDGRLPGKDWVKALLTVEPDPTVYSCPRQRRVNPKSSGYALNEKLLGQKLHDLAPNQIVFFDADQTEMGAIGDPKDYPLPGRHRAGAFNNVVYSSGSARATPAK